MAAENLDDAEFWLPPQFLADDHDDDKADTFRSDRSSSLFPVEFGSLGFSSDLSSPVESVVGSSEAESDEEDFMAGLTLRMACSTLDDGFKATDSAFASENGKVTKHKEEVKRKKNMEKKKRNAFFLSFLGAIF